MTSPGTSATTPAPAPAAPAGRGWARALAQARFDASVMLRNGEQLLLVLILPAMALVAGNAASIGDLGPRRIDVLAPGVLALAVLSTAFTGQAIVTAFDRRSGVLRLLSTTPLGPGGLVLGRVGAVVVVEVVQVVVLGGLAAVLGWRPHVAGLAPALLVGVLGTAALVSLGVLLGSVLRPEATLAVANLVWVLLLGLGAVVVPASTYGQWSGWTAAASWLPSGALADGLRAAWGSGRWDLSAIGVLLVWAAAAAAAAARWLRWD